ncbi:hypothetical protein LWI29_000321 [Acer saccharum]|uniref:(+)-delta-cadinene synthase n=1 Tax=Acer saccharum TaxID=4024 RepID=A0AA39SRQ0_ACESA|nr:hypothetical protein LWI29_000321 [Acer saccharum]
MSLLFTNLLYCFNLVVQESDAKNVNVNLLELKEEIKRMLMVVDVNNKPLQKLDLIDAIQRLRISYHFETEIDEILETIHKDRRVSGLIDDHNVDDHLHSISLQFRLLRQHGHKISCDVFNKFKDSNGNFKESLVTDIKGMLSLYEATHLRVHGEDILEEALAFTTSHLESMAASQLVNSPLLAEQVNGALNRPIRRGLQRLDARHYMSVYQEDPMHNKVLLTFAKLDFNILQKQHQKELSDISRWWKNLDFSRKLPFARDRVVEWDVSAIDQLPEYMKCCYEALLDVYSENEKDFACEGKLYRLDYAKEAMKDIVRNYFWEAKWCHEQHLPTMEEYMPVALVTSAYKMLATTSFVGMGEIVTKQAFEWLFTDPNKMVQASSLICRLMDDMVSHKFEQKRGHVASSAECFMNQHGATEEETCNEFRKQVISAWKDINEECLLPTMVPMPLLTRILNLARVIDVVYKDEDGYTHAGEADVNNVNVNLLELKEEIKRMLMVVDVNNKPLQKLDLIDAVQRLGISYHFETEIDEILETIHKDRHVSGLIDDNNVDDHLHSISLQFRLLRQHGHKISCDVFNKFKDSNGNFKESLVTDIKGMLSLYEATHLRVHGEDILEEALAFTTSHLESMAASQSINSPPLAEQVNGALNRPIRRGLQRLDARHYMSVYQEDPMQNKVLLTFAKLDFNILQKQHQKELIDISRWWKNLDFSRKLPFARDRVVECYFWILGVYFEPEYILARRILTKVIAMTSVIDDIYDVYGTIEELEIFTSAVERWDISAIDQLPEYMKCCYEALLDVYSENEKDFACKGKLYRLDYAKDAMKDIVRNYFWEAKWCHEQHVPTMEEYMPVALVTSAYKMLATTSFVGMGEIVTKQAFEWLFTDPNKMVEASSLICRLMDDMVSHKFEQKRGHVASSVECFMNQHGATEEETCNEFRKQVRSAWKDINEECLLPTMVPMPLLTRVLNLARVIDVVYKDEDGYTHAGVILKDFVASLLINPVPI